MMEGEGSDGGTDGGEESGGAGLSFRLRQWSSCVGGASCPGRSSFAHGGRCHPHCRLWSQLVSLGLGCRLWVAGCRSWVVGPVRRRCTSFVAGGLMCGVIVVCCVVAALHRSYGCHVTLLATWPLYPFIPLNGYMVQRKDCSFA